MPNKFLSSQSSNLRDFKGYIYWRGKTSSPPSHPFWDMLVSKEATKDLPEDWETAGFDQYRNLAVIDSFHIFKMVQWLNDSALWSRGECGYVSFCVFSVALENGINCAVVRMSHPDMKVLQCAEQTFHQIRLNLNKPIISPTKTNNVKNTCKFIYLLYFTIIYSLLFVYITTTLFLLCWLPAWISLGKDGIIEKSEALMVARGDLGYSASVLDFSRCSVEVI